MVIEKADTRRIKTNIRLVNFLDMVTSRKLDVDEQQIIKILNVWLQVACLEDHVTRNLLDNLRKKLSVFI